MLVISLIFPSNGRECNFLEHALQQLTLLRKGDGLIRLSKSQMSSNLTTFSIVPAMTKSPTFLNLLISQNDRNARIEQVNFGELRNLRSLKVVSRSFTNF